MPRSLRRQHREEDQHERANRSHLRNDGGTGDGRRKARVQGQTLLLLRPGLREGLRPQTRSLRGHDALGGTAATPSPRLTTVVLDVSGLHYATEKNVVETALGRGRGVHQGAENPASQTATLT